AVRPAISLDGLSRGHCAGRMDSAAATGILSRAKYRHSHEHVSHPDWSERETGGALERALVRLRRAAAGNRRRTCTPRNPRRRFAACLLFANVKRQPAHHRKSEKREAGGGDRRKFYWAGSGGIAARAEDRDRSGGKT